MTDFEDDLSFGRLAVRMGLCSEKQIKNGLDEQRRREIEGQFDHLGSILVENGKITRPQLDRILQMQKEAEGRIQVRGFEIISELGRGAMGIVYRARQLSLERDVALKLIPKGPSPDKAFKERFIREAKSAAKLSHPNIIKAIDAGESQDFFYFAMELYMAPHLLAWVKQKGPMPERELVLIAIQMAKALAHAHEHHLVHRDIKPENILYQRKKKIAKLTDMGLARSTSPDEKRLTKTGATLGTPYYMSPEAVKGLLDIDIRADIYSLGATLYHLSTGRVPFDADTAFQVLRMHLDTHLVPPKQVRPELSDTFSRIIARMMRKDPRKRHGTPDELLADLERLRDFGPEEPARTASRSMPARRKRSSTSILVGVSVAALAVLVGAAVFLGRGPEKEDGKGGGEAATRERTKPHEDAPSKSPTGEEPPATTEPQPTPPEPGGKEARALEQALAFAKAHPEDVPGVIERLMALVKRYPMLADDVKDELASWKARAVRIGVENLFAEAGALVAKKSYGPAVRILHAYPIQNRVPPDAEIEIKKRCNDTLVRAKSEARLLERKARSKFNAGEIDEAIEILKSILIFEIMELGSRAESRISEYRVQGELVKIFHEHIAILDNVSQFGLHGALGRLPEGEENELERKNLKAAINALEGAVHGARKSAGKPLEILLRDGRRRHTTLHSATDACLTFRGSGGSTEDLPWNRVSLESVSALGEGSAKGFNLAALAWYFYRDADRSLEILESVLMPGGGERALREYIAGALKVEMNSGIHQAEETLEKGQMEEAKKILRGLLKAFRDTTPFEAREGEFRELVSAASGGAWEEAILPFLFRGEVTRSGSGVRVAYDFVRSHQFRDFKASAPSAFRILEGRIEQGTGGTEAELEFPGRWVKFTATIDLHFDKDGGISLLFRRPEGLDTVLEIRKRGMSISACFRRLMLDGRLWTVQKLKDVKAPEGSVRVRLRWVKGRLWARIGDGKEEYVKEEGGKPAALAIRAMGPFALTALEIDGSPEPGWVDSPRAWEKHHTAFMTGKSLELVGKVSTDRWRREGGKVEFLSDAVHLLGDRDETRLWLPEGRTLLGGDMAFSLDVEVRRGSDRGYFFLAFRAVGKDLAWLIIPEQDETPPPGAPPEYAILSMVAVSDGQWHKIHVEVKPTEVALYVDGAMREVFSADMLKDLAASSIPVRGLGFGRFGGEWEVKSFRLRRLLK